VKTYYYYIALNLKIIILFFNQMGIGDWGLGIGDWGLGIGDWGQNPKPQTPNPKPQTQKKLFYFYFKNK